jgi:hypothetical protein
MPPATPTILYQTSTRATALIAGVPRYVYQLPQESPIQLAAYGFDVDMEIVLPVNFPPAPKNTPSSDPSIGLFDVNAILCNYTQPQTSGAAMGKFSARFNIVPASWDDFKTMPFTFPGWIGIIGQATSRDIQPVKVTTRLHYDYFVADPNNVCPGILNSAGAPATIVTSASLIPRISKSYFCNTAAGSPVYNSHVNSLVKAGGQTIGTTTYVPTLPTVDKYQSWISNVATAVSNPWGTDVWNGLNETQSNVGQIVADDSFIQPYSGNIWARITPYILVV